MFDQLRARQPRARVVFKVWSDHVVFNLLCCSQTYQVDPSGVFVFVEFCLKVSLCFISIFL